MWFEVSGGEPQQQDRAEPGSVYHATSCSHQSRSNIGKALSAEAERLQRSRLHVMVPSSKITSFCNHQRNAWWSFFLDDHEACGVCGKEREGWFCSEHAQWSSKGALTETQKPPKQLKFLHKSESKMKRKCCWMTHLPADSFSLEEMTSFTFSFHSTALGHSLHFTFRYFTFKVFFSAHFSSSQLVNQVQVELKNIQSASNCWNSPTEKDQREAVMWMRDALWEPEQEKESRKIKLLIKKKGDI